MVDRLEHMLQQQRDLQLLMPPAGRDPSTLDGDERADFVRTHVIACTDELHEALDCVGWKPWATYRGLDRDKYLAELIDAFHFWMNLWLLAGGTSYEWYGMYEVKAKENAQRQQDGYHDGPGDKEN